MPDETNSDPVTVKGFGEEWSRFDQSEMPPNELVEQFERYFSIFPWISLPPEPTGFDLGCGSGRWALHAAPRVGKLHCVDASGDALRIAKKNLMDCKNVEFHEASVDAMPFSDESMDFGYSLGVLHHVPDTAAGIASCARKLKPGAPLLIYLYYAFDNRPFWFRLVWKVSDRVRNTISILPFSIKKIITDAIAATVYFPLARMAGLVEYLGGDVERLPLSTYRNHSFYTMRTDALDRFGTRLEQRFTRNQIQEMMENAGLEHVRFRAGVPYWCALGIKRPRDRQL